MKRKLFILIICTTILISNMFSQTVFPDWVDGHLYFKFKDSYRIDFVVNDNTTVDYDQLPKLHPLFEKYGVTLITRPLLIFEDPALARIIRVQFEDIQNVEMFIKELIQHPDIESAEKVPLRNISITYNDPYYMATTHNGITFNFKWHLEMINAPQTWDIQTGASTVKVAIVDNAVWGAHTDLNISSANQCNWGNGYAIPGNSAPPSSVSQTMNCTESMLSNGYCESYNWSHGTHCAGLVGAINNNGIGISSIGSGVTLMGIRTTIEEYSQSVIYGTEGVSWAINNGAKVVSMSYGGPNYSSYDNSVFQTAANNGVILIAAAGNEGDEENYISYPGGYASVISVASVNADGKLSYFSQWGPGRADIAAPGGYCVYNGNIYYPNILSTTYNTNQFYKNIVGYNGFNNTHYDGMQGTSMACPIVAGLAGLMVSAYPNITPAQVKSCLQSTATPLTSGSNQIDGNGYINAYAAVQCAQSLVGGMLTVSPNSLSFPVAGGSQSVSVTSNVTWTVSESCNWVTVSPASGSNNGSFTVSTSENTGSSSRSCEVTVSGTGVASRTVLVTQSGTGSGDEDNCQWVTNITLADIDNMIEDEGAYYWSQDRVNDIIHYAERMFNSVEGTIDSIDVYVFVASSYYPSSSNITFRIHSESGGFPGSVLASKTLPYSYFTENTVNSIRFDSPASVNGNFFVSVELNYSPISDVFGILATGNIGRNASNNTMYVKYNNAWSLANDLFTNDLFGSFYIWAKVCPQDAPSTLTVNPSSLSFTANGGSQSVSVTSNTTWTVSESCDWITVSPTSGSNNGSFSVTASANTTTTARSCTITVSATGATSRTVTVTQEGTAPSLTVTPLELSFGASGGNQSVTVMSNTSWTISESCDWIAVSPTSGSNNGSFTVTASANTTTTTRSCSITVSATGTTSKTVVVNQEGATITPTLTVNPTTLSFSISGGNQTVIVSSNVNWTVLENCDWLLVSPESGSNNSAITVTASANQGVSRTCNITVSASSISETIAVTQEGNVGVETYNTDNTFTVYPNPTTGVLSVKADFIMSAIEVLDLIGRSVFIIDNIRSDYSEISISHLSDAIYLIKVYSTDGNYQYRKIVKN